MSTIISSIAIDKYSGNAGSLVITSSNPALVPQYFLNLINIKVSGDNPSLPDNSTLNPVATIYIMDSKGYKIAGDILLSKITTIGGSATPGTLAGAVAAIAALITT